MEFQGHVLAEAVTTLPRELYVSDEIFEAERERVFRTRWLAVGRTAEIPATGDSLTGNPAGESVLFVRGEDREIRAFYNFCRHRGTRLCDDSRGRFPRGITCPYHAWTYTLDGSLRSAPNMSDTPGFDRKDYPLLRAASGAWEGFLFTRLASKGASLEQALSPLLGRFAAWRLSELEPVRRVEYEVRANWKLLFQNFSECDHCPPVHPALARLSHWKSGANDLREGPILGGYMRIDREGGSLTSSGRSCGAPLGDLAREDRGRVYYYSIFPSLFLTVQPDFAMATRIDPVAPDATRVTSEWLFAPRTLESAGYDPEDGISLWDATNREDWHVCELAQRGVASRAYVPGPYATRESLLAAFDREYLSSLGDVAAAPPSVAL